MTWQKEVDELKLRGDLSRQMGGPEGIAKQRARGKLTVRERINHLLDPDSFREVRGFIGATEYDEQGEFKSFTPGNAVIGYGRINGRQVCVRGDDFTIRGGSTDEFGQSQSAYMEKVAELKRVPMVKLLDGAGGSVREVQQRPGGAQLSDPNGPIVWNDNLIALVPVVSAVLGACAGWIAVSATVSHFSVMTKKTGQLFTAGPLLVKAAMGLEITKESLGDWRVHTRESGVIDNPAEDEEDAFRQIKLFLSYLPQNVWQLPPRVETGDDPNRRDEDLLSIIPRDRRRTYDIRKLIRHVVDRDSIFELAPLYGRSLVTVLARMDGYPVALMANDCKQEGGAQTPAACEKMVRFADMADTFHLPLIYLADVPGFMLGPDAERRGILRRAARAVFAVREATVPSCAIVLRRLYGVAAVVARRRAESHPAYYAWPSAESGSLPTAGGVMVAFRKEIEAAPDPDAKRAEIENRINNLARVLPRSNSFIGWDIIDPRDTRPLLCQFVKEAQEITLTQLGPKTRIGIRP